MTQKKLRFIPLLIAILMVAMISVPTTSLASSQPKVELGLSTNFAVLAGQEITNDGTPVTIKGNGDGVGGDIGVFPGTSITELLPVDLPDGEIHSADTVAADAQLALTTAYLDAAGRTPVTQDLSGTDLGGLTLTPGVYSFSSDAQITGTLTLDGNGDSNPVFIFKIGSTLITASGSKIILTNGAIFCRIFWQVTSSATLGSGSTFVGHIFALTSITANSGASIEGQLLARNGSVFLHGNTITNPVICNTTFSSSSSSNSSSSSSSKSSSSSSSSIRSISSSSSNSSSSSSSVLSSGSSSSTSIPHTGDNNIGIAIFLLTLSIISFAITFVIRNKIANK